jgi:undecaprenyl pyrophosphate phosphatase UppP
MPLPRPMLPSSHRFTNRTSSANMLRTFNAAINPVLPVTRERALSGIEISSEDLIKYNNEAALIAGRQRFYDDMQKFAPMAKAYQFSRADIAMMTFVLSCAASGLPLYIIGSAAGKEMINILGVEMNLYVVGAAYANFLQNILYAYSFARAARNFQNENKYLLGWSIFWGVITASVPTAAMFKMGQRKNYSFLETTLWTVMTFTSTAPLTFFGIYEAFKRRLFQMTDNPLARKYLLDQLTEQVCLNPRELSVIKVQHNAAVKELAYYAGILLGTSQVLSIWPWTCDSEITLEARFPTPIAWLLSIGIFNLPNLLIAGIFSGFDLGELMVNGAYQNMLYLTGEEEYYTTPKEAAINISLFMIGVISMYFCYYSSLTSYDLTETECPSLGIFDGLMLENVNWGTIWGNFALTMISVAAILRTHNQMSQTRDWIYTAPTEEVETIAIKYFPSEKDKWQRVALPVANSVQSRFSFLSNGRRPSIRIEEMPLLSVANLEPDVGESKANDTTYLATGSTSPRGP